MKQYVFRLTRGSDLLESIRAFCREKRIRAGCIACCVGCLSEACLRSADGATLHSYRERLEIVSVTGTVSEARCHIHTSLSREDMTLLGGHLCPGCIVNTTAEVVLCELAGVAFSKTFDPETGYNELSIETAE